ncbi:hypothetical protein SPHV1_100019 [Novosphingobium sp. KN65.2]|nr:hypothetical protein SPHV1_100019 [Novosphingobium sp. KN65.2]
MPRACRRGMQMQQPECGVPTVSVREKQI